MIRLLYLLVFCLAAHACRCQELPAGTRQQLEGFAAAGDEEPDESFLLQLEALRRHPLNLNKATGADLELFSFLTPLHIAQFLNYRTYLGPFTDLHELQAVPGWDVALVRQLLPFISLSPERVGAAAFKKKMQEGNHMLQLRWSRTLQIARGYDTANENKFLGSPNALLARYLFRNPQGLQYGIVAEKDAGEPLFKKRHASPDFLSAHLFWKGKGIVKNIAIGDYTANLGQGLIHWQTMAFGKSSEVLLIKRQSPTLRPYASAGEFYFLRGLGTTLGKGPWELSLFAARQKTDAHTGINGLGRAVISSFYPTGLHRTASEYSVRHSAGQMVAGGNIRYQSRAFGAGVNAVRHWFSLPVQKNDAPYNLFGPSGSRFFNLSADYSFSHRNMHLFGEAAVDCKGQLAGVQGALVSIHPAVDVSLLGRYIQKGYTAIAAQAFTEGAAAGAESGIYTGLQWRLPSKVRISAYADLYRFLWLRFRTDAPGSGKDYLFQLYYQPSKETEMYLLLRSEEKPGNLTLPQTALRQVIPKKRTSIRAQAGTALGRAWQVRSRIEGVRYNAGSDSSSSGFLLFADVQYKSTTRLAMDCRIALFNTEGFESRIYAYENDVLYGYSIPALYGQGMRVYANMRCRLGKGLVGWLRVAHTVYAGVQTVGTGQTAIDGNSRTDVRTQLVYSF